MCEDGSGSRMTRLNETQVARMMRVHKISRKHAESLTVQEAMDMNTVLLYNDARRKYDAMKRRQKREAKNNDD